MPVTSPTSAIPFERQGLHVMAKPIGPICNLDCAYCYYLHKEDLYPGTTSWRMPLQTLEHYIQQLISAQPEGVPEITFAWQGGEPTLLGVAFFEQVVAIQARHVPKGVKIFNTLQTNGTLLDADWIRLFKTHNFLIGLSIDGPAELHDRYRVDKHGRGSFADVLRGLKLLKAGGIEFNALVVVNRHNGDHGRRIYTYLRDSGVQFLQFIPIVEQRGMGAHGENLIQLQVPCAVPGGSAPIPIESRVSSRSVLPEQYGRFLTEVFDEWSRRDIGRVFVQIFDQALSAWLGIEPSLCVFRQECGRALAIEHNGDVYSCDHFVEPAYQLGNIHTSSLAELANSERQRAFGAAKSDSLPQYCRTCDVQFVCNGECPKNRFVETPDGEAGLNYLCAGYQAFFRHIRPTMVRMTEEVRAGRPAANVMSGKRDRVAPVPVKARGRRAKAVTPSANAPCSCGSGQKYKRCCGRA